PAKNASGDIKPRGTISRSIIGSTTCPPPKTKEPTLKNVSNILTKGLCVRFVIIGNVTKNKTRKLNEVIPAFFEMFTEKGFTLDSALCLKSFIPNIHAHKIIKICIQADG